MKTVMTELIVFVLTISGALFVYSGMKSKAPVSSNRQPATAQTRISGMFHDEEPPRELDPEKVMAADRLKSNLAAVAYSCLEKYHRDSCLHNLIACGSRCTNIIPQEKFQQISSDYWQLRRTRGI
jgi:hypothetical protein